MRENVNMYTLESRKQDDVMLLTCGQSAPKSASETSPVLYASPQHTSVFHNYRRCLVNTQHTHGLRAHSTEIGVIRANFHSSVYSPVEHLNTLVQVKPETYKSN